MVDFSASIPGDKEVFVPNPYFYDPSQQRFSKITWLKIPTPSTMLAALQSGEIQLAQGDISTEQAARASGFTVVSGRAYNLGIIFNLKAAGATPLQSVAVRQAMNYALNRPELAKSFGQKATDEVQTTDGLDPKYNNYYTYDPAKAKSLLASAGYPNGFTLNDVYSASILGSVGTPLIEAIASQEAAVGIKLNINPNYTFPQGWPPAAQCYCGDGPMTLYYGLFMTGDFGWTDPFITALYNKLLTTPPKKQLAYYRHITDRLVTQGYWLPVLEGDQYWYEDPHKVTGMQVGNGNSFWDIKMLRPVS
jgi:peptide/nickel transport system substrate-binding protein